MTVSSGGHRQNKPPEQRRGSSASNPWSSNSNSSTETTLRKSGRVVMGRRGSGPNSDNENVLPPPPPPIPSGKIHQFAPSSSAPPSIPLRTDLGETLAPILEETKTEDKFSMKLTGSVKSEKICHPTSEQMNLLTSGDEFFLLTKKGKLQKILIQLTPTSETFIVKYSDTGKTFREFCVVDITSVECGHCTPIFTQFASTAGKDSLCLAILIKHDVTIDLVAYSEDTRDSWYNAMTLFLKMYKRIHSP